MNITRSDLEIPESWKRDIERTGGRSREYIDDERRAAIDAMILQYYPRHTQRQIAMVCKCSTGHVANRVCFLRDSGKLV